MNNVDYEKYDVSSAPSEEQVSRISELASSQVRLTNEIKSLEEKTKEVKAELANIAEKELPEALLSNGVREIKLEDGTKISVNKTYLAGIVNEKKDAAFNWLREHGHEHLIKEEISISFKKKKKADEVDPKEEALINFLVDGGYNFVKGGSIHWQTLRAFVKEQLENEETSKDFPKELFGVFVKDVSKIC